MATRKDTDKPRSPLGDVSKDKPRMLERVSDGARTRVTDPLEFMSLTTAYGYRDVTDSGSGKSKGSGGSSNTGTGSGGTPASDNTTSK